jgi:hypothetical protein
MGVSVFSFRVRLDPGEGVVELEVVLFRMRCAGYPALEAVRRLLGRDGEDGRYAPFSQRLRGCGAEVVAWGAAAEKLFREGGAVGAAPVGRVAVAELQERARSAGEFVKFRHVTPAVFRRYGRFVAAPVEELYLARPAAVWRAVTGEEVVPAVKVVEALIHPVRWPLGKDGVVVPGFVGRVVLRIPDPVDRAVALLAGWTGVGAKTAWGMGEVVVRCAGKS